MKHREPRDRSPKTSGKPLRGVARAGSSAQVDESPASTLPAPLSRPAERSRAFHELDPTALAPFTKALGAAAKTGGRAAAKAADALSVGLGHDSGRDESLSRAHKIATLHADPAQSKLNELLGAEGTRTHDDPRSSADGVRTEGISGRDQESPSATPYRATGGPQVTTSSSASEIGRVRDGRSAGEVALDRNVFSDVLAGDAQSSQFDATEASDRFASREGHRGGVPDVPLPAGRDDFGVTTGNGFQTNSTQGRATGDDAGFGGRDLAYRLPFDRDSVAADAFSPDHIQGTASIAPDFGNTSPVRPGASEARGASRGWGTSSDQAAGSAVDMSRTNDLLQQLLDEVRKGRPAFLPIGDRYSY